MLGRKITLKWVFEVSEDPKKLFYGLLWGFLLVCVFGFHFVLVLLFCFFLFPQRSVIESSQASYQMFCRSSDRRGLPIYLLFFLCPSKMIKKKKIVSPCSQYVRTGEREELKRQKIEAWKDVSGFGCFCTQSLWKQVWNVKWRKKMKLLYSCSTQYVLKFYFPSGNVASAVYHY